MKQVLLTKERIQKLELSTLEIFDSDLPKEFDGLQIVQLSDFHFGAPTKASHIRKIIQVTNTLNPELIFLSGDYVQKSYINFEHRFRTRKAKRWINLKKQRRFSRRVTRELGNLLADLKTPPSGIFGVFGNHDHDEGLSTIIRYLDPRIIWLKNRSAILQRAQSRLQIAGVDDLQRGWANPLRAFTEAFDAQDPRLSDRKLVLKSLQPASDESVLLPSASYRILISHNPDITKRQALLKRLNVRLITCGHTHGGQICYPSGRPLTTHTQQRHFVKGLGELGPSTIYVSSGLGYGGIPLRLWCPAEIVRYILRCPQ